MPSPELERSLKIKERLEASLTLKKLLLMLVLAGTAMVIADGVVTPAMSGICTVYSFVLVAADQLFNDLMTRGNAFEVVSDVMFLLVGFA